MSRAVAMLLGDAEISDVTSKPTHLTDWRFDDTSSSSFSVTGASASYSTSFVTPRESDVKPMLGVKINEGR